MDRGGAGASLGNTPLSQVWPLPPPAWVVSASISGGGPAVGGGASGRASDSGASHGGANSEGVSPSSRSCCSAAADSEVVEDRPMGWEFAGLSWLFNGPQAAAARAALLPARPPEPPTTVAKNKGRGLAAACCAALCCRPPKDQSASADTVQQDYQLQGLGLTSCVDFFEASLLARSWKPASRLLDETLGAGAEAWEMCALALARVAHDSAAAAAGAQGRALPLLHVVPRKDGDDTGGPGAKTLMLLPDGPQAVVLGPRSGPPPDGRLGAVRHCAGVQAWLRLCRPVALWNAAGRARGFAAECAELPGANANGVPCVGSEVVEALQAALAVQLTESLVSEVWDALAELELAPSLLRRANGSWTRVDEGDDGGFVL